MENPIMMDGYYARLFLLCQTAETNVVVALMKDDHILSEKHMSEFEKLNAARCLVLQASQIHVLSPHFSADYLERVPFPDVGQVKKALEGMEILFDTPTEFFVEDKTICEPRTTLEQHDFLNAVFSPLGYSLLFKRKVPA